MISLGLIVSLVVLSSVEADCVTVEDQLWPSVKTCSASYLRVALEQSSFSITSANGPNGVLDRAFERAKARIFPNAASSSAPTLPGLVVTVSDMSANLTLQTDESYELSVGSDGSNATLTSKTVWGALRGLETFLQLVTEESGEQGITGVPISISDEPSYSYRGLMLDTARHFLPIPVLKRQIDALSAAKGNVLHLHLVDAQSFPLAIDGMEAGAYAPNLVYKESDLSDLASYAQDRGVMIVPEIDMPGHSFAWGFKNGSYTANCPAYAANINNIPLTPYADTMAQVQRVLSSIESTLNPPLIHLGGDEVVTSCWEQDPQVVAWVQQNHPEWGTSFGDALYKYLVQSYQDMVSVDVVHWNDVFDNGIKVRGAIQAWRPGSAAKAVADYPTIFSEETPYYLNCGINPSCSFFSFDTILSQDVTQNMASTKNLLGVESVMFGEFADHSSVETQVWVRATAVLQVGWAANNTVVSNPASNFACRMQRWMNLSTIPLGPGFC